MSWARIEQGAILALGLAAVVLLPQPGDGWRWAVLCGLFSQPFWVASAWRTRQWGVLGISLVYTLLWGQGVWKAWS